MRAAVLREHGEPLDVTEVEAPSPDPGGVVVEVGACGICRSDWHGWQGEWGWLGLETSPGQILGHEPAGHVVEVGPEVERVREGDHVAIPFTLGDGTCEECRTGHGNTCDNTQALGFVESAPGAFAELVHVPHADHNIVHLPESVTSTDMAGLGCRFMTAFHGLAHRAPVAAGDWVAVHGCGGVGLSAVHIADALGANVVAVDLDDDKLARAADLGATETLNAAETERVPREIKGLTDGGCNVSIDALGIEETCRKSILGLGKRGTHVQIGLTSAAEGGDLSIPSDLMVMQEIEFVGSLGLPPTRYDEIFRMVATDKIDPGAVVGETVGLADVSDKLAAMTDFETAGIPVVDSF